MIALAPIDYGIIAAIIVTLFLRIAADRREVKASRKQNKIMRAVVQRSFSPMLTVFVFFETLEGIQNVEEQLKKSGLRHRIVAVVDTTKHPRGASPLRYYAKYKTKSSIVVVGSKKPDLAAVARKQAARGLAVLLPNSAEMSTSFYFDAILPFNDKQIDAVQLVKSVRIGNTISSALEVIAVAWRNYFGVSNAAIEQSTLQEGIVIRAKHLHRQPKKSFCVIRTPKASLSVAPAVGARATWVKLKGTILWPDYSAAVAGLCFVAALALVHDMTGVLTWVIALLAGMLLWWALGLARITPTRRVMLLLLTPLYLASVTVLCFVRLIELAYASWREGCRLLGLVRRPSHALQ